MAFASEIKALLEVPGITAEIDPESLHQFLTFLWVPDPKTMFRGIFKLPAGHYAIVQAGRTRSLQNIGIYVSARERRPIRDRKTELADEIRQRFRRSVEAQMVSDVPIGAFLSAGLDSSSIVAMMSRATTSPSAPTPSLFLASTGSEKRALDDPAVSGASGAAIGDATISRSYWNLMWLGCCPVDLAHGRTDGRPRYHSRLSGVPRGEQAGTVLLSGVGGDEFLGVTANTLRITGRSSIAGCRKSYAIRSNREARISQFPRIGNQGRHPAREEDGAQRFVASH